MSDQPQSVHEDAETSVSLRVHFFGLFAGPTAALAVFVLLQLFARSLNPLAAVTAAVGTLMAIWWMTEAVPLAITSLLPLVLFPLAGVMPLEKAAAAYAEKNIFLFMGGFMIALAVERWNLHRRIALLTVLAVGTRPDRLIGGIMAATAGISMWISNTATAAMMLPIGLSLVSLLREHLIDLHRSPFDGAGGRGALESGARGAGASDGSSSGASSNEIEQGERAAKAFATCVMLGIAYSASIGGLGTLVGTPTNVALSGFASKQGISIGFGAWMAMGVPLVVVYVFCTWLILTKRLFPIPVRELQGGRELIRKELTALGRLSRGEITVMIVFGLTAALWVLREPLEKWKSLVEIAPAVGRLDDAIIAMSGAIILFLVPVNGAKRIYALDWATASKLPWGVLLLFGGGFAFTAAMTNSGLTEWLGQQISALSGMPPWVVVVASVTIVIFTTELTSNTPTILAFLPILHSVAVGFKIDPLLLMIPATLAASCAFMLPVGTPPNAIVFGTGQVTIGQMVRAGWLMNLIGIPLITIAIYTLGKFFLLK